MTVSVIIPNYNAAKYLRQAIGSVLSDDAVIEVVIVDNASTDDSLEVIRSMSDPRIRLICSQTNVGAARARHLAVSHAVGDLLCFLDADDFLSPGAVTVASEALAADQVDLSIFEMARVNEDGTGVRPFLAPPAIPIDGLTAFSMTLGTWRIHPMGVFRRQVYERAMERAQFHGYSDDELITRHLFLATTRVGGNGGVYHYRVMKKPRDATRTIGQGQTALEVFTLARVCFENPAGERSVRAARNLLVRLTFELAARGLRSTACAEAGRSLRASYRTVRIGWRPSDIVYLILSTLTPLMLGVGRR